MMQDAGYSHMMLNIAGGRIQPNDAERTCSCWSPMLLKTRLSQIGVWRGDHVRNCILNCLIRWRYYNRDPIYIIRLITFYLGVILVSCLHQSVDLIIKKHFSFCRYFSEPELLDRVPNVFLLLGGCYAILQLIGSLLLGNPPVCIQRFITIVSINVYDVN